GDGGEIDEAVAVESDGGFGAEDFEGGLVDAGPGEFAALYGLEDPVVGAIEVAGDEDEVGSGLEGFDGGAARALRRVAAEDAGEAVHVHGIGDNDAMEAELVLQQAGGDAGGDGGGAVRVGLEGWN